jgi:proline iminopeptidase
VRFALVLGLLCACTSSSRRGAQRFDEDHIEAINGMLLHYRVRGYDRGHPYLVILHGGPGASALEFYPWGEALERELNVVYLDQRGCGLSQRVQFGAATPTVAEAAQFSLANLVRDIEGVRERLGVKRWYVVGHSFGGMLGIEYALTQPTRIAGYIHMAGLISVPMIDEDWLDYAERAVTETRRIDPSDAARVDDVLANVAAVRAMSQEDRDREIGPRVISKLRPEQIRARRQAANTYDARIDAEVLERYHVSPDALSAEEPRKGLAVAEHFATREVVDDLPKVRVPTLVLAGAQDPIVPPKRARFTHERIAGSTLVVLEEASHDLYKDQPTKSADAVLAFVRAHP